MTNVNGGKRGNYKHKKDYIEELMKVLKFSEWQTASELMAALGIEKRFILVNRYIVPAYEAGLVEYFMKSVPAQRNQLYKKTQEAALLYGI